jgi:ABC-type antimicrobial peptide transport system permease subunit
LVCIAAILIGTAVGGFAQQGSGEGLWPAVFVFPLIALPIAFVLIIVLIVVVGRQRSKAAKAARAADPKGRR